jgi:hypothetical protein
MDYGAGLSLIPRLKDPVWQAQGILKGGRSLTAALLHERERDRKREDDRRQAHAQQSTQT